MTDDVDGFMEYVAEGTDAYQSKKISPSLVAVVQDVNRMNDCNSFGAVQHETGWSMVFHVPKETGDVWLFQPATEVLDE